MQREGSALDGKCKFANVRLRKIIGPQRRASIDKPTLSTCDLKKRLAGNSQAACETALHDCRSKFQLLYERIDHRSDQSSAPRTELKPHASPWGALVRKRLSYQRPMRHRIDYRCPQSDRAETFPWRCTDFSRLGSTSCKINGYDKSTRDIGIWHTRCVRWMSFAEQRILQKRKTCRGVLPGRRDVMKKLAILVVLVGGLVFLGTASSARADHLSHFHRHHHYYGGGYYGPGYAIRGWGYRPAPRFFIRTPNFAFGISNYNYGGYYGGGWGYPYGYGGCNRW
jgi:hypothetical protein